jgi:hypothetical protein
MRASVTGVLVPAVWLAWSCATGAPAWAESSNQGAETCQRCHEPEFDVWQHTKHFTAFREAHKNPKAKDILAAVGGASSMKSHPTCVLCHYTMVQAPEDPKPAARSGPSCESCHGNASAWLAVHNEFGGSGVPKETESPEHRTKRWAEAEAAGMIRPHMKYAIAANCMSCHGLARPGVDGETLGKMLAAGHPVNPDFDLVQYSQGTVRHRFYPPNATANAEMTPAELARLAVTGHAAKLVSAAAAMAKSSDPAYQQAQQQRVDAAAAALSSLTSVPEAAALVASPTEANAQALVKAIADKDLSAEVKLPSSSSYK